jgi:ankyrin repeat protein
LEKGYQAVAKLLVDAGADETLPCSICGHSPLSVAVMLKNLPMVVTLVSKGHGIDNVAMGSTALYRACAAGHVEIVRYLVSRDAGLDIVNAGGWTALLIACSKGFVEIAQCLVAKGSDLAARTPIQRLAGDQLGGGHTPLHIAAMHPSVAIVRIIVDAGADIGDTALMDIAMASKGESAAGLEVVTYLLKKLCNIDAVGSNGMTAYEWALQVCAQQRLRTSVRIESLTPTTLCLPDPCACLTRRDHLRV